MNAGDTGFMLICSAIRVTTGITVSSRILPKLQWGSRQAEAATTKMVLEPSFRPLAFITVNEEPKPGGTAQSENVTPPSVVFFRFPPLEPTMPLVLFIKATA